MANVLREVKIYIYGGYRTISNVFYNMACGYSYLIPYFVYVSSEVSGKIASMCLSEL